MKTLNILALFSISLGFTHLALADADLSQEFDQEKAKQEATQQQQEFRISYNGGLNWCHRLILAESGAKRILSEQVVDRTGSEFWFAVTALTSNQKICRCNFSRGLNGTDPAECLPAQK